MIKLKILGKVIKILIIILLVIVLLINISIIIQTKTKPNLVPSVFGYKPFIVLSGSMESQINVGDLVIVKEVDAKNLKTGDIIAFRDSKDIVTTHRIVDITTKNNQLCFKTKGDANNAEDNDIVYSNMVEGKYQTKIAKIGNTILFIQKPVGFAIILMSILIICLLVYLYQNRKINEETKFKDEEERKAFEEFMKKRAEDEKHHIKN